MTFLSLKKDFSLKRQIFDFSHFTLVDLFIFVDIIFYHTSKWSEIYFELYDHFTIFFHLLLLFFFYFQLIFLVYYFFFNIHPFTLPSFMYCITSFSFYFSKDDLLDFVDEYRSRKMLFFQIIFIEECYRLLFFIYFILVYMIIEKDF